MSDFVCLYFGRADECPECGGFNETGTRYCSHDCADDAARRQEALVRAAAARRANEDLFAAEGDRLRAAGYTDREIDVLLAGIPT